MGSLQHRARFLCGSTLSAEYDDSSIVLQQSRFSDLLFRLCDLRRRFGAERFVFVRGTDVEARRQTAGLGGTWGAVEVLDSTLQLWLRAFMSSAIALIRSRNCSRIAVGVRAGNCRLGSRIWSRAR